MSIFEKLKYKVYLKRDLKRRLKLIRMCNINTLIDVGANKGQYANKMRNMGYKGKIVSFEPVLHAFSELEKRALKDKSWTINNFALGDEDTTSLINVSGVSDNSSFLRMRSIHSDSAEDLKYVSQQEIEIKKLDSIFSSIVGKDDNILMKIDTQGFEKNVIDGASNSLEDIMMLQLEMSIVGLYENEMLYREMTNYLEEKGFHLCSIENGHYNRNTGQLLQFDGLFINKNLANKTKGISFLE